MYAFISSLHVWSCPSISFTLSFTTLIHAFMTSRLDFCNSIYYPLAKGLISRVQTIQNACAKTIMRAKKFDSTAATREKLHWLPIQARSQFKILLCAHKIAHSPDLVPFYFASKFSTEKDDRCTRHNISNTLKGIFDFKLVTLGSHSIFVTISSLWNALSPKLRDMERTLPPLRGH